MPTSLPDLCLAIVDGAPCLLVIHHTGEHVSILTGYEEDIEEEVDEDGDEDEE